MTGRQLQRFAFRLVRGRLAVASGYAVLGQLTAVVLPLVIARAIDDGLDSGATAIAGWCALVLVVGAAGATLRLMEQRTSWLAGAEAVAEVRSRVARGVVRRPPALERGEVVSRLHRDGDLLWEWLSGRAEAPGVVVGVVGTIVAVSTVDLGLTAVAVGALVGAALIARVFPEPFERRSRVTSEAHGRFAEHLDALVGGLVTVRGLGAGAVLVDGCRDRSRSVAAASRSVGRLGAGWRASAAAVPMLGGVVGLVVGALGVADGRIGVGGVVAFSAWMVILAQYTVGLVSLHQAGRMAAASSARLAELLDQGATDAAGDPLAPADVRAAAAVIGGHGPLHLTAHPGGLVDARVGDPDTAARLLTGEATPDAGTVEYGGRPLDAIPPGVRAATLRRAPQQPILVAGTIADNVALGRTADRAQIEEACRVAGILDDVRALPDGFDTVLGDRGQGLSGGQRQRLGVARALLGGPPVVVLDDALNALDERTEAAVRGGLDHSASSVVVLSVR